MKNAIIISGGNISDDFALDFLEKQDLNETLLIAADRGLEFFERIQKEPDIALGDFDSLSSEGNEYLNNLKKAEIIRLKPEKDDSDTQSALNCAIDRGAHNIFILGATGSRIDHLMANLGLLVHAANRGARAVIIDPHNYAALIESGTVLEREKQFGKFVSFFSLDGDVYGLTLTGFKYPLSSHRLCSADSGLTVSNEIESETARIEYERGTLLMIMTKD